MSSRREALARPFSPFGRRAMAAHAPLRADGAGRLSDDVRLFALTFAGGFIFMAVYLA